MSEFFGDTHALEPLVTAYQDRQRELESKMNLAAEAAKDGVLCKSTFNSNNTKAFVQKFDNCCRTSFINTITKFKDHSKSITSPTDFKKYLVLSKDVFGPQWKFLSALWKESDSAKLCAYKERQVFCTILALQCIANLRKLPHWGMINTAAQ